MAECCPWLPEVHESLGFERVRRHGAERGPEFYVDALTLAHELWLAGRPAEAILQLNKAWSADLPADAGVLRSFPPPYRALAWMLGNAGGGVGGFYGDPVRHFQHLASRMSGARGETRAWRAWVCHHLSRRVLGGGRGRGDGRQIAREGLWIPGIGRSLAELEKRGWTGESAQARGALCG